MFDPASLALVAITDDVHDGRDGLVARAVAAVRGGATMIQLRLKHVDARTLVEIGRALVLGVPAPVLVNDRVDVALACGAAGAHVGFDDLPVAAARRLVPQGFVLGASLASDPQLENARAADYVGIGPVFPTPSKADAGEAIGIDELRRLTTESGRPSVAIGGIDATNAGAVIAAGASGAAVIRAVLSAPDPEAAARALRSAIGR